MTHLDDQTRDEPQRDVSLHTVIFQPGSVIVRDVPAGETILRAAARADLFISSPCAGAGSCGKCLVRIGDGEVRSDPSAKISTEDWERGMRLACSSRVSGDVVIYLPDQSALGVVRGSDAVEKRARGGRGRYLEAAEITESSAAGPIDLPVQKVTVSLAPPSAVDRTSDLARFKDGLRQCLGVEAHIPLSVVQVLSEALRAGNWTVSALLHAEDDSWGVGRVQAGGEEIVSHIAIIDLGTTTVWGQLVDARHGCVVATAAAFNQQIKYGEDVISRMVEARADGGKLRLQTTAAETVIEVLEDLVKQAAVPRGTIDYVALAGNTTMTSLLLGVETHHLRLEPYIPPFDRLLPVSAIGLGLGSVCAPGAVVEVLPVVGSYVGGDVVAGVLASGLADGEGICLYLDVGTNGEAVIGTRDWLLATSCSAGPAFEGGGIRYGMRATAGAIESVTIDRVTKEVAVLTIDDVPPVGICGSGVIDAVAELLQAGILLPNGRYDMRTRAPGLRESDGSVEYVLVSAEFSGIGADIVLTEADVDNVVRAKAAMFAGVTTLLKTVALEWNDLERIIVAGAFGRHLRVEEAMSIGLFPELDPQRFEFIGNGSLLGTRKAALSRAMMEKAAEIAGLMNNIELSDNVLFEEEYVAARFLPHTDMGRFPAMERVLSGLGVRLT